MGITRFNIEGKSAVRSAQCSDVPQLMVIAGPNGVGKSTLLEELRNALNNPHRYDVDIEDGTQPVYISPHRAPEEFDISDATLSVAETEGFIESMSEETYKVGSSVSLPQLLRSNRERSRFQADYAPYYEVKKEIANLYRERTDIMSRIVDRKGKVEEEDLPDIYTPIEDAVDSLLPGIKFEGITRVNGEYQIQFKNRTGDTVEYDGLSSGERDSLAIVFSLLTPILLNEFSKYDSTPANNSEVSILLDGPESYLHPQFQLNLLNYIEAHVGRENGVNQHTQVIMVTHSKAIIDNVPEDSLYYLFFNDQVKTNQLKSAIDLPSELKEVISEEIGLSAIATGQDLLLVEGSDDREVFNRIDENLKKNISIIPMEGKKPIVHLDNIFNKLIPRLQDSGINIYAIVDRDRDMSSNQSISERIHVLPVTMVENLILDPNALYKAISEALGEKIEEKGYNTQYDIDQLLNEIVTDEEFIMRESQQRWNENFNPVNVNYVGYEKSEGFSNIDEFAKNEVKNRLNNIDDFSVIYEEVKEIANNGNLDELHGKKILKQISNEFGIRTDMLLRMTARRISVEELPPETKKFLNKIKRES